MSLILQNIANTSCSQLRSNNCFYQKLKYIILKPKVFYCIQDKFATIPILSILEFLRSFNINDNIVEHVLNFACEGYWIGDMYSLISQKPGNLFIEVLEDAEMVFLSKENQEIIIPEIPKLERFFRILTENSLVANQERLMDNLSLSAEERFEKFCYKIPNSYSKSTSKTNCFLYRRYS